MSDGAGESGREYSRNNNKKKKKSRTDDFVQAIAKIAVAQVCDGVGFQGFQQSAFNTLSDVAVRYINEIGVTANLYANLAGRNEGNVFDIIQGLEDLVSSEGFSGASDVNRCLAASGIVRELIRHVHDADEIPFAYLIPHFPIVKDQKAGPTFTQLGETPPDEHMPAWLPAFPDPQTYIHSPTRNEREGARTEEVEPGKEDSKPESSFLNLQQRLGCNGSELLTVVDPGDAAKAKQAAESNPFLAAPLRFGEKEVSSVVLPPKLLDEDEAYNHVAVENHVSVLDTFRPAIEALKNTSCDSEVQKGRKTVLQNTRPAVQFKLGISKRPLGTLMNFRDGRIDKISSWFGNNNEKDQKKRRAEQILKESVENPQELSQL